ncbi:MAG: phosphoribosylamine--glycine ligase [Cyclobacteriaceae bacterium]|nr:phosphoribosylamine--glycine ligase [Cyclobacteriaceae bacterium]
MNVLIIGSGGREHTLAWKIRQSPQCERLYVLPGNAGTTSIAENPGLDPSDYDQLRDFILRNKVDLVVVGPEAPLVDGIRDYFNSDARLRRVLFIGPGREGAMLEGSKDFAKQFMNRHRIPTAASATFTPAQYNDAIQRIQQGSTPVVVKADGLAAGKGVIICETREEAEKAIIDILLKNQFGEAGNKVVIEEFLEGIEVSVFLLTDGRNYVVFPEAKDYKRIGDNDTGPNTGGMGSVSPVIFADPSFMKKVEERIIKPTIEGLKEEKIDFTGFIFLGLMNVSGDPYVIEYNVRMGDPESQVVIPRINNDFIDLLAAAAKGRLEGYKVDVTGKTAVTVVLASGGYPGSYEKGKVILGLDKVKKTIVFHAGTGTGQDDSIITRGGRVLAVTGMGENLKEALELTYSEVKNIHWEGMQYRKDIGRDLLELEK